VGLPPSSWPGGRTGWVGAVYGRTRGVMGFGGSGTRRRGRTGVHGLVHHSSDMVMGHGQETADLRNPKKGHDPTYVTQAARNGLSLFWREYKRTVKQLDENVSDP
jgi:hypothetical protein